MIRFGPSGNSDSFYDDGNKVSEQAPAWLKQKWRVLQESCV